MKDGWDENLKALNDPVTFNRKLAQMIPLTTTAGSLELGNEVWEWNTDEKALYLRKLRV